MIEMQPNTIIQFGKYEIFRKLALGGMAELYLAKQRGVGGFERTVVVKCILPQYATDPQFVTMFLDEARIASQLNHPNIVQIYEIGEVSGLYYISMEYVRGPNFKALRKALYHQSNSVDPSLVAGIMVQVCAGLHHAHCAADQNGNPLNIVHRDVSPTNLLLTFEGNAKLVDFGVAKASIQEHETKAGMVKGKYRYMSPEQILAHPIDHRSDIYALGAILYELSTGVVLFQRRSEAETIRAVYMDPIVPPSAILEDYPPELERIVMKALERDANDRYPTADAMRRDLDHFLHEYGVYYGPRQLAESLRGMFTQVFESSINQDPGSALTRNDYARFGLSISSADDKLHPGGKIHTLSGQGLDEVTSPSADPSSPSSFHASTESSAPSGLHPSRSGHEALPTKELDSYSFADKPAEPELSEQSLRSLQAPTDPIPAMAHPSQHQEKKSVSGWLLALLLLLVVGSSAVVASILFSNNSTSTASNADMQLQQLAEHLQDKKWKQADALLQVIQIKDLNARQKAQRIALQRQLHRGQTLEMAQQLYQKGEREKARKALQALQTRYPEDKTLAALAEQWKQPETNVESKKPLIRKNNDDEDDDDKQDDDSTDDVEPRRTPPRRIRRPRRRIRRVRRPFARRRIIRRKVVVAPPKRLPVEPRPRVIQPGVLFVPALSMARVDLDGNLFGYTPINGKKVPPGRHTLRVSRPGYRTVTRTIVVREGKRLIVPISLQKIARRRPKPPVVPLPRRNTPIKPKPKRSFASIRLSRGSKTLRIVIIDRRGISGNTYTYQFRSMCRRIERATQQVLGSPFSTRGITYPLQRYVRRIANLSGQERMTFNSRAIAYVIYRELARGRSKNRVAQLLLSYQKRKKFRLYRNR